jgi:hypothetical protein
MSFQRGNYMRISAAILTGEKASRLGGIVKGIAGRHWKYSDDRAADQQIGDDTCSPRSR